MVRTKDRVKPLYVSVGHMIGLREAADWVLRLAPTHRLPEPIRLADRLSKGHAAVRYWNHHPRRYRCRKHDRHLNS